MSAFKRLENCASNPKSDFEDRLLYTASSRTARATQRDPASNKQTNKQTNKQKQPGKTNKQNLTKQNKHKIQNTFFIEVKF